MSPSDLIVLITCHVGGHWDWAGGGQRQQQLEQAFILWEIAIQIIVLIALL